jgi:anti-anti-sigma factor
MSERAIASTDDDAVFHVRVTGPNAGSLHGELDASGKGDLSDAFLACDTTADLLLDLSGLTFVDSTGLTALLQLRGRMAPGARVLLIHPGANVRRVLALTGLDQVFTVHE